MSDLRQEDPTAGRGLPVSLSGLANGEEHHVSMIVHSTMHSSPNPRKVRRSQPVVATPSDLDHFLEVVFYETRKAVRAFCGAEGRHIAPLEGRRVAAWD